MSYDDCNFDVGRNEVYFGACETPNTVVADTAGFRFITTSQLSSSAPIDRAFIWFKVDGPYTDDVTVDIYGQKSTTAAAFSSLSTPASRPLTNASVAWSITPDWDWTERWSTVDITPVIEEITQQSGWSGGNALAVIIKGQNSGTFRRVFAYERDSDLTARLVVYFKHPDKSRAYYPVNTGALDWDDQVTFNNQTRLNAYTYGYNHPNVTNPVIVLAFGRQLHPDDINQDTQQPVGYWGVKLVQDDRVAESWVTDVAQAYIDGYNDNPAHTPATIVVGTSNATYDWLCENDTEVDARWGQAGSRWGYLVGNLTERTKVKVFAGNDVESWEGEDDFGSWEACGWGTEEWFVGYSYYTSRKILNFGSYAYGEMPTQWTEDQQYATVWGRPEALIAPQIYTTGQAQQWAPFAVDRKFYFFGLTSSNGSSIPNGTALTYDDAWYALYDELESEQYQHSLRPSISTFHFDN